jgi:hypothetical protein
MSYDVSRMPCVERQTKKPTIMQTQPGTLCWCHDSEKKGLQCAQQRVVEANVGPFLSQRHPFVRAANSFQ